VHLCVLYVSHNKHRLLADTALPNWFSQPRQGVFTARYELDLYIKDITFRNKMLNTTLGFRLHKEGDFVFSLTNVSFSRPLYHRWTVRYIYLSDTPLCKIFLGQG
jgi:hypothetical protein